MNSPRRSPISPLTTKTSPGLPGLIGTTTPCPPESVHLRFENAPPMAPISNLVVDVVSSSRSVSPNSKKNASTFNGCDLSAPDADLGLDESSPSDDNIIDDDDIDNDETTSLRRTKENNRNKLSTGTSGTSSTISPSALSSNSPSYQKSHVTIAQRFSFGYPTTAAERRVLFSSMRMRPKNLSTTGQLSNGSAVKNDSGSGDSGSYGATTSSGSPVKSGPTNDTLSDSMDQSPDSQTQTLSPSKSAHTPPLVQYRQKHSHFLHRRRRHHVQSATTASSPASMIVTNGEMTSSAPFSSETAMVNAGADNDNSSSIETITPRENSSETTPSTAMTPALSVSRSPAAQRYSKQHSFGGSCGSGNVALTGGAIMPAFSSQILRSLDSIQRFGAVLYSSVDDSGTVAGPGHKWQSPWDSSINNTFDLDSINEFGDLGGKAWVHLK